MARGVLHRVAREVRKGLSRGTGRLLAGRRARAFFAKAPRPLRLHVGCGDTRHEGWVNVDRRLEGKAADVAWDLRRPFPLEDGACSRIYTEHVLEHFTAEEGVRFLRECHRLLRAGGIVRTAMPDLAHKVRLYLSEDWEAAVREEWRGGDRVRTRAEMMNMAFRSWGHRWLYDQEELRRRLAEAGFREIRGVSFGESPAEDLRGLERRLESRLILEAVR